MDSALTPRDIQARIRAGESVEDVARAAGVPTERVEPFAAPVIAERAHVAGLALSSPVRRRGEHASVRQLRSVTTEALVARGVDPDDVEWDAALLGARRWQITATFKRGKKRHLAQFVYDLNGRFSVAGNDDARWMIGEASPRVPARPAAPRDDDELAIVRAIQEPEAETKDAYHEAELAEVDGVYELVPADDPEMDALYDMLASFDEDSVRIYTGLVRPDSTPPVSDAPTAETPSLPDGARVEPLYRPDDVAVGRVDRRPADDEVEEVELTDDEVELTEVIVFDLEEGPAEPEQPPLVTDEHLQQAPKPGRKTKRASVPSWDEIMFGAPRSQGDRR